MHFAFPLLFTAVLFAIGSEASILPQLSTAATSAQALQARDPDFKQGHEDKPYASITDRTVIRDVDEFKDSKSLSFWDFGLPKYGKPRTIEFKVQTVLRQVHRDFESDHARVRHLRKKHGATQAEKQNVARIFEWHLKTNTDKVNSLTKELIVITNQSGLVRRQGDLVSTLASTISQLLGDVLGFLSDVVSGLQDLVDALAAALQALFRALGAPSIGLSPNAPKPAPVDPTTPSPATPAPATPAPGAPSPATPAPATPAPATPAPATPATPAPATPAPATPAPAPATPAPATPAPAAPVNPPTTPAVGPIFPPTA
ncbi:hypothetical protein A4X09_0g4447 [Tilletia walkeri]|uniref:Uncharacterized protein n=1 Tax=Tilletia walkeri TaxID=117179 RepID=A0A8X7T4J9_9BASI|nr:hypothetical protein A4X09_0g4447 [Tilletia walkeri]